MMNSSQEDVALQALEMKEKILEQTIAALSHIHQDFSERIVSDGTKVLETNNIAAFDSQEQNIQSAQNAYLVAVQAKADDFLKQHNLDLQKKLDDYTKDSIKVITEIVRKS